MGLLLVGGTLGSPLNHDIAASLPEPAQPSTTPARISINSIVAALELNYSVTVPIPRNESNGFWHIECDHGVTPPGWAAPPDFYEVGATLDCTRAITKVTREGDPLQPQVWSAQANWSHRSCGVSLIPGQVFTRVNFARVDISEIAKEVANKCVNGIVVPPQGGWAAIGGYFIVLVTGTGESRKL